MMDNKSNATKKQHMTGNLLAAHVGINAPHFKSSRFYNFPPAFERMFAAQVSHADQYAQHLSLLSPAAYFVDLIRLYEQHIDGWESITNQGSYPKEKTSIIAPDGRLSFAGTENSGVYRRLVTSKNGSVWEPFNNQEINGKTIQALAFAPDGRTLFAGTADGLIFRCEDASETEPNWHSFTIKGLSEKAVNALAIAVDPGGRLVVYANTEAGVYRWSSGTPWQNDDDGSNNVWQPFIVWEPGKIQPLILAVTPNGKMFFAGTPQSGIYRCVDTSAEEPSWQPFNNEGQKSFLDVSNQVIITALAFTPDGRTLYAGTSGYGVYRCLDAAAEYPKWQPFNDESLIDTSVTKLAVSPDGKMVFAGTAVSGIFRRATRTLRDRRPDLWQLPLDQAHTEGLVPFLDIVNNVLRTQLLSNYGYQEVEGLSVQQSQLRQKRQARKRLATAPFPLNIPVHIPLLQIRAYLAHVGIALSEVYETFGLSQTSDAWAAEALGLSPIEFTRLATPNAGVRNLIKVYGITNSGNEDALASLEDVATFLKQTGLTTGELEELMLVTGLELVYDEEGMVPVEPQRILNLNPKTLDYLNRFIRLRKQLGWSFSDLHQALRSINLDLQSMEGPLSKERLGDLARFKQFSDKHEVSVELLANFLTSLDTSPPVTSQGSTPPRSFFDRIFNKLLFNNLDGQVSSSGSEEIARPLPWDTPWDSTAGDNRDREIRFRLQAALNIGNDDLQAIIDHICAVDESESQSELDKEAITLDVWTLTRLYNLSAMAKILGIPVQEYLVLLNCITGDGQKRLNYTEVFNLQELWTVDYWVNWLKEAQINAFQLEYLITGQLNDAAQRAFDTSRAGADIAKLPQAIKTALDPWTLRPSAFASGAIPADKAEGIYSTLLNTSLLKAIMTSNPPETNERQALVQHGSALTHEKVINALTKPSSSVRFPAVLSVDDLQQQLGSHSALTSSDLEKIIKQLQEIGILDSNAKLAVDHQGDMLVNDRIDISSLLPADADRESSLTAIRDLLLQKAGAVRAITNVLNQAQEHQTQAIYKQLSETYQVDSALVLIAVERLNRQKLSVAAFALEGDLQDIAYRIYLAKAFNLSPTDFEVLLNDLPLIIEPLHGIEPPEGPQLPDSWKAKLPFLQNNEEMTDWLVEELQSDTWSISAMDWRNQGVLNIAPQVSEVKAAALSPDGAIMFAACGSAGIWRSCNDGSTWQTLNDGLEDEVLLSLAVSADGTSLFAGTENGRIFQAQDPTTSWQKVTWQKVHENAGGKPITLLASTADGKTLFTFSENGLFRGVETGGVWPDELWQKIDEQLENKTVESLAVAPEGQAIFMHNDDGIFHSIDKGDSWSKILTYREACVAALPGGEILFAYSSKSIFRYKLNGENWPYDTYWTIPEDGTFNKLAVTPDGRKFFVVVQEGPNILHTVGVGKKLFDVRQEGEDFRITWPDPLDTVRQIHAFRHLVQKFEKQGQLGKDTAKMLAAYLRRQADRPSLSALSGWEEGQVNALQTYFTDIAMVDLTGIEGLMVLSRCFDLAKKLDGNVETLIRLCKPHPQSNWLEINEEFNQNGGRWQKMANPREPAVYTLALTADAKTLFAGTVNGVFTLTLADGPETEWQELKGFPDYTKIDVLAMTPDSKMLFASSWGKGVFICDPQHEPGAQWQALKAFENEYVETIALAPDGKTLYASVISGGPQVFTVLIGDDSSDQWQVFKQKMPHEVYCLVVTQDSKTIIAGTRNGVYTLKSEDNPGAEWQELKGLPNNMAITALAVSPDCKTLFAGSSFALGGVSGVNGGCVFSFNLEGESNAGWLAFEGLKNKWVKNIELTPDGSALFAATQEDGVYVLKFEYALSSKWLELEGLPFKEVKALALTRDGETLFAGGYNQIGSVYRLNSPISAAFEATSSAANNLIGALKSKAPEEEWEKTFGPIRELLHERERDALAALLLHEKRIATLQDLSNLMLIDVQMSGCADTSYIKEAIGCLQIYIERCRLNLEEGTALDHDAIPDSLWTWMGHFRLWEANRKVFFYPENYLEPSQRRQATPEFKELQNELLQGEIIAGNVTKAYNSYFDKVVALSKLTIVSSYYTTIDIPDEDRQEDRLYLFAISHTTPPVYYHRSAVVSGETISAWQPWQRIDLAINAGTLSAVHYFGKLFIFWVEQKEETQMVTIDKKTIHVRVTTATVKYSFQNISGSWVNPQTMSSSMHDLKIGEDIKPIMDLFDDQLEQITKDIYEKAQKDTILKGAKLTSGWPRSKNDDDEFGYAYDLPESTIDAMDIFPTWKDFLHYSLRPNSPDRDKYLWTLLLNQAWICVITAGMKQGCQNASWDWNSTRPFTLMDFIKENLAGPVEKINKYAKDLNELAVPKLEGETPYLQWQQPHIKDWSYRSVYVMAYENQILVRYGDSSLMQPANSVIDQRAWVAALNEDLIDHELTLPMIQALDHEIQKELPQYSAESIPVGNRPGWRIENIGVEQFLLLRPWEIKNINGNRYSFLASNQRIRLSTTVAAKLGHKMFAGGADHLLTIESQRIHEIEAQRDNDDQMSEPYLSKQVDFNGAFGLYFWEIFFHIPFLIADALNGNQQFEQAYNWYKTILDPTRRLDDPQHPTDENGMWRFLPFRGHTLEQLQEVLNDTANQDELIKDAFNPDAIARTRLGAYEKAVAMKYVDNLLDWGDMLFAQDSWEAINQAAILYGRVLSLLGPKPQPLKLQRLRQTKAVSHLLVEENGSHKTDLEEIMMTAQGSYKEPFFDALTYFNLPENDAFADYWDRAQDRFYKIRHCLNISGVHRQLALFQPPIDPRLIIQALASGVDISSAAAQLTAALPHYRFSVLIRQAKALTATVSQVGAALLSALEKKEAEALNILRSTHEQKILNMTLTIKELRIEEGRQHLRSLQHSLDAAAERQEHYRDLIKEKYSTAEKEILVLQAGALLEQTIAALSKLAAVPGYVGEVIIGPSNGPTGTGDAVAVEAQMGESLSMAMQQAAGLTTTIAQFQRRAEEWKLQEALAGHDQKQITAQIESAQARQTILEQDLAAHQTAMDQARDREEFFHTKFTNQELYQWMAGRLATVYFQTYRLAVDLGRSAERAYQYERQSDQRFIEFGMWDSLRKGLLAGEGLMLSLNQLEKTYLDGYARELEIEKTISLLQLDPQKLLALKREGRCTFEFKEQLFDYDFPGHYCRRIKTISVSIPAVVGPHQNIQATLIQKGDRVLVQADEDALNFLLNGQNPEKVKDGVLRSSWRPFQQIAISKGLDDSGMFQLNFNDDRYLPFEGTGAVSRWELRLPKAANRGLDFNSISDVIIKLSYTALDGGETFRNHMISHDEIKSFRGLRLYSLRQEFSSDWQQFIHQAAQPERDYKANKLPISLKRDRLALGHQKFNIVDPISVHFLWKKQPEHWEVKLWHENKLKFTYNGSANAFPSAQENLIEYSVDTDWSTLNALADIVFVVPFKSELVWDQGAED